MFDDVDRRAAEQDRNRENSARLAKAFAKFHSTGQGSIEFEDHVDFGLTFIEEPYVTYGSTIDLDGLGELLDTEPGETPPLPLASGMVTEWDQDDRDFYVGCWTAVRITFQPADAVDPALEVEMEHHFTFTAVAIKDVPLDVRN